MQYTQKVMEHFQNPHNQGKIKDADGVGETGNIRCGDIMKLYIKVGKNDAGQEIIEDIRFETLGCAAAIASTSVLTDLVKGKTFEDALKIDQKDIIAELGEVPAIKVHCSVLAHEALAAAIEDYKSKK